MYTIQKIRPLPDFSLELIYGDGNVVIADFKPLIEQGGVFSRLADPQFFAQVKLGERGRYIEWPKELDFCADSFRIGQGAEVSQTEAVAVQ